MVMAELMKNQPSHWWWLDTQSTTKRSPWLQSTLNELNEKTKAILKLIEEDADSFAKRAEMYYKKRPELISMVEDFYRTHRSLAERYDQVKPDAGLVRQLKNGRSPSPKKSLSFGDKGYDSYSENCDVEESVESEVDDPDKEEEEEAEKEGDTEFDNCTKEKQVVEFVDANDEVMRLRKDVERLNEENKAYKDQLKQKDAICEEVMMLREEVERLRKENRAQKDELKQKDGEKIEVIRHMSVAIDVLKLEGAKMRKFIGKDQLKQQDAICDEVMMLREEVERLRKENRAQKDELKQKDGEKIEVIRHMSFAIDVLKQEGAKMRKFIAKESAKKWKNPFEFNKLMGALSGKMFNGGVAKNQTIEMNQTNVVAL